MGNGVLLSSLQHNASSSDLGGDTEPSRAEHRQEGGHGSRHIRPHDKYKLPFFIYGHSVLRAKYVIVASLNKHLLYI